MTDQPHRSGSHILNRGPLFGKSEGARNQRRFKASKYADKTDLGRDELFKHRMGFAPKGYRMKLNETDSPTNAGEQDDNRK